MGEQIAGIIGFRNFFRRGLHRDHDFLCLSAGRCGKRYLLIRFASCHNACRFPVCGFVRNHGGIAALPGNLLPVELIHKRDIAADLVRIGNLQAIQFRGVCVRFLHTSQFFLGQVHDGSVAFLKLVEGVFARSQDLPGILGVVHILHVRGDDRQVTRTCCVLVCKEAVLRHVAICPVLLVEAEEFWSFQCAVVDLAVFEARKTGKVEFQLVKVVYLLPGCGVEQILRLHDADAAVLFRVVAILGGAVVPVADLDDGRIDDFSGLSAFFHAVCLVVDQELWFREVYEVSRCHIVDRIGLSFVLRLRIHDAGCEEDDVLAGFFVVDHLRRPGHACVFRRDLDPLGFAPVYQIRGFVHDQVVAACRTGIIVTLFIDLPAASVVDAQVGRHDKESVAFRRTVHVGIAKAFFADGALDDRLAVVHVRKVASVFTDGEVDLFLVFGAFADEVGEQIAGIIGFRNFFRRGLHRDHDFLCLSAGRCGKRYLLIRFASCHNACRFPVCGFVRNHGGIAARPGNRFPVELIHKRDIAADLICIGNLQACQRGVIDGRFRPLGVRFTEEQGLQSESKPCGHAGVGVDDNGISFDAGVGIGEHFGELLTVSTAVAGVGGAGLDNTVPVGADGNQAGSRVQVRTVSGDIAVNAQEVLHCAVTAADARQVLEVIALGGIEAEELIVAVGSKTPAEVKLQRCSPVAVYGNLDSVCGFARGDLAIAVFKCISGGDHFQTYAFLDCGGILVQNCKLGSIVGVGEIDVIFGGKGKCWGIVPACSKNGSGQHTQNHDDAQQKRNAS